MNPALSHEPDEPPGHKAKITISGKGTIPYSVNLKGLSEREVMADMAIWPIRFSAADNGIRTSYRTLENDARRILSFLDEQGFKESAITLVTPSMADKVAQNFGKQNMALQRLGYQGAGSAEGSR